MSKHTHTHHPAALQTRYVSYVIGFVLSVVTTLIAYFMVVHKVFETRLLILAILGVAVVQLVVQVIFFLHIGHGSRWKLATFIFTLFIVILIVVGSIWIMDNLNYNMMQMSPDEQRQYMSENEGI